MPLFLSLKVGALLLASGALLWLVDEIGDRREAKVRREIAAQVVAANRRTEEAETRWRRQYELDTAEREKIVTESLAGIRAMASGTCDIPPGLLRKLNAINPRVR